MKSHKILKRLAGLTACLSALGTHGSAFAKVTSETKPTASITEDTTKKKDTPAGLAKEPPENRINRALLSRFEENIGNTRVRYDKKLDKIKIEIPIRNSLEPLIITDKGINNKKDLAKTVCRKVLKGELEAYMKDLSMKTFAEATDNDFSDWKFLQPKKAASDMRERYEYTVQMRRKLGHEFKDLAKNLPKDELGILVDKIIKENGLLDVEFPPDFYRLITRNARNARNLPDNFEMEGFYE